jgi:hypothetical protein
MALSFIGQRCALCGREMKSIEQVFSFPAFVQNTKDPFYQFNDSVFHVECLKQHLLGDKAVEFANQFIFRTRPENRICSVGGNIIRNFDDYIFIDLLTSDEQEDLYSFNFTTLDRGNLKKWDDRSRFVTIARTFKDGNKWGDLTTNKYLDNLIERIGS